jgi:aryl-alcohol dehydrogenase-like predicted oxidoreductase
MDYRTLGRTGWRVSALGFGCGNVGGLMVRGTPAERERAVARALEMGINYFDTAPIYGDGESERNLGQVIRALKPAMYLGTKVRLPPTALGDIPGGIARSLEESLRRLGLDRVDLLQLHNPIAVGRSGSAVSTRDVLDVVVPALARLVEQGKIRFYGITALGDTPAVLQVIDAGVIHTAQVCYNLLEPTAVHEVPAGFPAQDFGRLMLHCRERSVGVIVIRVLAAGALSGLSARHPVAVPTVDPIASASDYGTDVQHAQVFSALVKEGYVESLVEASLRFALAADAVSTVLLGYSSLEHLEYAAACVAKGPLPVAALARLPALWAQVASG